LLHCTKFNANVSCNSGFQPHDDCAVRQRAHPLEQQAHALPAV
jgi:hypothetical protein